MKKILIAALVLLLIVSGASCSSDSAAPGSEENEVSTQGDPAEQETSEEENEMVNMTLKINDEEVDVKWEDNESVRALAELAAADPVTVNTSRYGGFEQVGGLGTTLPSNDVNTTTDPGDIVLYSSSNIVVFFGNNSWAYTRLGHIEGKSDGELRDLLGGNNAVLTFIAE